LTCEPGRSTPKSMVISYDLDSFALTCQHAVGVYDDDRLALKCMVPTTRSPLFTASGSGRSSLACLSYQYTITFTKKGTYCQCVRIAVCQLHQAFRVDHAPSGPVDKVTCSPPFGAGGVASGFSGFAKLCQGHSAG